MIKETGWYTGDQKPTRVGAYKMHSVIGDGYIYSWWNGIRWSCGALTLSGAYKNRNHISSCQSLPWCGLTKENK